VCAGFRFLFFDFRRYKNLILGKCFGNVSAGLYLQMKRAIMVLAWNIESECAIFPSAQVARCARK